ncbi:MAG: hypothetical protein JWQ74_335 [Marmoricola sp.]|nr:hypothetical protein [Marmoricola sp.]
MFDEPRNEEKARDAAMRRCGEKVPLGRRTQPKSPPSRARPPLKGSVQSPSSGVIGMSLQASAVHQAERASPATVLVLEALGEFAELRGVTDTR